MDVGPSFPWYLGWWALAILVVCLIHESGHLGAALWTGQQNIAMHIGSHGPLMEKRLAVARLQAQAVTAPWRIGGSVVFSAARTTARSIVIIALAGPVASLAGAAVAAVLAASIQSTVPADFCATTSALSIFAALLNLVPMTLHEGTRRRPGARLQTDGRQALDSARVLYELRSA